MSKHTFAICAYESSQYLEECVKSIQNQSYKSDVIICTSTPNELISSIAEMYGIKVYLNTGEKGITQDWNFALSNVATRYATIAHQDDIYERDYAACIIQAMEDTRKPLFGFCDYGEIHNGIRVDETGMLKIKRLMLSPLRVKSLWRSRFVRRRVLSLGDPICCPAVTFCMNNVTQPVFRHHFRSCEDWEAWEKISRERGSYVYIPKILMYHRIHEDSETTKIINDGQRISENYEMFRKFWPAPIARLINMLYTRSEHFNRV